MAQKTTPMMRQYRRIKEELPDDAILFFRLGDFYEMFFDDARRAAPILDIALTKRNEVPMCGVPYHAADSYLSKLIKAGQKVAICDQVEDPKAAKGIVQREVTRIVTPGTVTEDQILDSKSNHFLAGVCCDGDRFGMAFLDLSTGLFQGEEADSADAVVDALMRHSPRECVIPAEQADAEDLSRALQNVGMMQVTSGEDWTFSFDTASDCLTRHFDVHSLEGFGCSNMTALVRAAGGVMAYVRDDLRRQVGHVRSLQVRHAGDYMLLDEATVRNLDLVPRPGLPRANSLLGVLDVTQTPMGGRTLKHWILRPLADLAGVNARHEAVEAVHNDRVLLRETAETLSGVRDLERLVARLGAGSGNARDVVAVGLSLACFPPLRELLADHQAPLLADLAAQIQPLPELVELIESALVDDPPTIMKDGHVIREGYNAELDEYRAAAGKAKDWLAAYQSGEQERTGIKNLKVRFNKVFGYYIEVSKAQIANVPEEYTRKQTLVNAERFITPELKEYENRILGAQEKAVALEHELFADVRNAVVAQTQPIQASAAAVGALDALVSLADRALAQRYTRPVMADSDVLHITAGRHPVIELLADSERFVPNDARLDGSENQLIIITGPNMAGKSTYIRQVALISIMAQVGSFVPADGAEIGLIDRVFTRVGASDDLARGRSTFMVEMQETANILNNATPRSLIVLDEIGRGTSTFDGISIAWAVAEYLHDNETVKAKTLFATHYHELTDLALTMTGVKNYNVLVREKDDRVVFLRRIVPGGSDKSYGIQVARLAGMPDPVVGRAKEILANLEEGELGETGQPKIAKTRTRKSRDNDSQLTLL